MYFITADQMQNENISSASKLALAVITKHCQEMPGVNLSLDSIATCIGVTEVTAMRAVRSLVDEGFISVEKNNRGWNIYRVSNSDQNHNPVV